jgi:hypothetical protein
MARARSSRLLKSIASAASPIPRWKSLALLTVGPALIAWFAWHTREPWVVVVTAAPAALALWLISRKLRDHGRSRRWFR